MGRRTHFVKHFPPPYYIIIIQSKQNEIPFLYACFAYLVSRSSTDRAEVCGTVYTVFGNLRGAAKIMKKTPKSEIIK